MSNVNVNEALQLFEGQGRYYVAWCDEGEEGAPLGQPGLSIAALIKKRERARTSKRRDVRETFQYWAVELAAAMWAASRPDDVTYQGLGGPRIGVLSYKQATAYLRAMRTAALGALRAFDAKTPWPEWALTAQAAGWTPPKGWKP